MSLGNCKLKQQDNITNLLEWLQPKKLTIPKVDEDVEQQESSFIADANAKLYSQFERWLGMS